MSYLGSSAAPVPVAFSGVRTQSFSGNGSTSLFTLNRTVTLVTDIEVIVNNVQQSPFDGSYSLINGGLGLQFSENVSAGTNNIYVIYRDQPLGSLIDQGAVRKTSDTGAAQMPVGTSVERPLVPANGMTRMNSTTGLPEWYDPASLSWKLFTQSKGYVVEYLVVAGGGAGGEGGGGAGGFVANSGWVISGTGYTATVGSGGNGGSHNVNVGNGSNSTLQLDGETIIAFGGGFGGSMSYGAGGGGSGGGGRRDGGNLGGPAKVGAKGLQGNAGGTSRSSTYTGGAGGGGGGATGQTGSGLAQGPERGGPGGTGIEWLNGVTYCGGGGGGTEFGATGGFGKGGFGGGGNGNLGTTSAATAGSANTGGGGGGVGSGSGNSGNGGSGIVIVRYLGTQKGSGGTITSSGGYTYHTFTSSGTFTA